MEGAPQTAKRRLYTPGARVVDARKRTKTGTTITRYKEHRPVCANEGVLHEILEEMVVDFLSRNRAPATVMLMSMVNKRFRKSINSNFQIWHRLYTLWLGPHRGVPRGTIKTQHGTLTLLQTFRSLPNFRDLYRPNS